MRKIFQEGECVQDRWWPEWGTGIVTKVLKTRIRVQFPMPRGLLVYDSLHYQFLEKIEKGKE